MKVFPDVCPACGKSKKKHTWQGEQELYWLTCQQVFKDSLKKRSIIATAITDPL